MYRNDDVDIWKCCYGAHYIGANATGEWLNYTIDPPYSGNYRLEIRSATPNSNRRVHVEFDGRDKTGPLTLPNTGGWLEWTALSTTVELDAGTQVMRLVIDCGGLNIDSISMISLDGPKVSPPTFRPNGGTFYGPVDLVIESATPGTEILINENKYGDNWITIPGPSVSFPLSSSTTIRAIAYYWDYRQC